MFFVVFCFFAEGIIIIDLYFQRCMPWSHAPNIKHTHTQTPNFNQIRGVCQIEHFWVHSNRRLVDMFRISNTNQYTTGRSQSCVYLLFFLFVFLFVLFFFIQVFRQANSSAHVILDSVDEEVRNFQISNQ